MKNRGCVSHIFLILGGVLGIGFLWYAYNNYSVTAQSETQPPSVINRANAVQGMADQRNHEIESMGQ